MNFTTLFITEDIAINMAFSTIAYFKLPIYRAPRVNIRLLRRRLRWSWTRLTRRLTCCGRRWRGTRESRGGWVDPCPQCSLVISWSCSIVRKRRIMFKNVLLQYQLASCCYHLMLISCDNKILLQTFLSFSCRWMSFWFKCFWILNVFSKFELLQLFFYHLLSHENTFDTLKLTSVNNISQLEKSNFYTNFDFSNEINFSLTILE